MLCMRGYFASISGGSGGISVNYNVRTYVVVVELAGTLWHPGPITEYYATLPHREVKVRVSPPLECVVDHL